MKLEVTAKRHSPQAPFKRFGGGWNWVLGIQLGGRTMIVNLLICSIRFDLKKETHESSHSQTGQ
jgi:hypothetical protein